MKSSLLINTKIFPLILFLLFISCKRSETAKNGESEKKSSLSQEVVPIILDTDIAEDYDDVGAMGMLHALADLGEIEILAVISSNRNELVVPTIDVINTWFGRPDIPVGAPKRTGVSRSSNDLGWPDSLVANYPHKHNSTEEAPDAVEVYRKILSSQPDSSVTIVSIGFLTNLKNLLISTPDEVSTLNGRDLVRKKVKHWVAMAGIFPEGKEYNVMMDSLASKYAIDHWPTPIIFSGFEIGVQVFTGIRLINEGPEDSPVRMAYAISIPKREEDKNGRRSWDQTALLVAARGFEPYFGYERGKFIARPDGTNAWKEDTHGNHTRLLKMMPFDSLAYEIESLMMHAPE